MQTLYFFTAGFPYGTGEQFIETEIKYLAREFSRIEILPLYSNDACAEAREVPKNVHVSRPLLPSGRNWRFIHGVFNRSPWRFAMEEWQAKEPTGYVQRNVYFKSVLITRAVLASRAAELARQAGAADVLYFYWGSGSCYLLPFLKKRRAASVIRFHNSDLYEEATGGYLPFREAILRHADFVVPISEDGASYLRRKYPASDVHPKIFRLGTEEFGLSQPSSDDVYRICSCSNINTVKRVELIAAVLSRVNARIEWTHIGDGPLRAKLEAELVRVRPGLSVQLLGRISNEAVKTFYTSNPVDLFINLSEQEGVPVSIMEALSAGIPVVATDCGGVAEIIDSSVGKLVPVDFHVDKLAADIESFAKKRDVPLRRKARLRWREKCNAVLTYESFSTFLRAASHHVNSR